MTAKELRIIAGRKPVDLSLEDWLCDQIARVERIKTLIRIELNRKNNTVERCREEIEAIEKEIAKIQAECPHYFRKYHPDPAGGSDSCHHCDECGKYW